MNKTKEMIEKQTIHIWKGQKGTMCGLSHYPQADGFVWLSKMGTMAAIQVNCEKCVESYTKMAKLKEQPPASEFTKECREAVIEGPVEHRHSIWVKRLLEACAIIDRSEASRKELLEACEAQHNAIDILFAMLIEKDEKFLPSKSGQPWAAVQQGNAAIAKAKKEGGEC